MFCDGQMVAETSGKDSRDMQERLFRGYFHLPTVKPKKKRRKKKAA